MPHKRTHAQSHMYMYMHRKRPVCHGVAWNSPRCSLSGSVTLPLSPFLFIHSTNQKHHSISIKRQLENSIAAHKAVMHAGNQQLQHNKNHFALKTQHKRAVGSGLPALFFVILGFQTFSYHYHCSLHHRHHCHVRRHPSPFRPPSLQNSLHYFPAHHSHHHLLILNHDISHGQTEIVSNNFGAAQFSGHFKRVTKSVEIIFISNAFVMSGKWNVWPCWKQVWCSGTWVFGVCKLKLLHLPSFTIRKQNFKKTFACVSIWKSLVNLRAYWCE